MPRAKNGRGGAARHQAPPPPATAPPAAAVAPTKRPSGRPRTIDAGDKTVIFRVSDETYGAFQALAAQRRQGVNAVARDLSMEGLKSARSSG